MYMYINMRLYISRIGIKYGSYFLFPRKLSIEHILVEYTLIKYTFIAANLSLL